MKNQLKLLVKQIIEQLLTGLYPLYLDRVKILVNEMNQLDVALIAKMKEMIPELRRF